MTPRARPGTGTLTGTLWSGLLLGLAATGAAACGSRSNLESSAGAGAGGGEGGAGNGGDTSPTGNGGATSTGTSTSTSTPTGTATLPPVECAALTVLSPIQVVPSPGIARTPDLGRLPESGQAVLTFLEAPPGAPGQLWTTSAPVFAAWPPAFSRFHALASDVDDYAVGPGPYGPVGFVRFGAGNSILASAVFPELAPIEVPFGSESGAILFAMAIPDRYFGAQTYQIPEQHVLDVRSYQPGSLPQSEDPLICLGKRIRAAATPSGAGFIAAFARSPNPEPCNSGKLELGTELTISHYESPPELGSFLQRTETGQFGTGAPIEHVALAAASFGAWLVFDDDGNSGEFPAPLIAIQLDAKGNVLDGSDYVAVQEGGLASSSDLAVAALGDRLAVAWVDNLDPSAPLIVLQVVNDDGSLGPATSIPTNEAWLSGRLRLLASDAANSLLVAWEADVSGAKIALARVDCVGGL